MAHTFCPIPWQHLSTSANGDLRVCCQCISSPYGKVKKATGEFYNAAVDDDREVRNTEIFRTIRAQMLKGERPSACELCWKEEALGKTSRRLDELKIHGNAIEEKARRLTQADGTINFDEFPVKHFDLRLGNQCNLKCRSCSPRDSSAWYDDHAKIVIENSWLRKTPPKLEGRYPFVKSDKGWTLETRDFQWHENSVLLKKIEDNLDHVERIYFTGGEPTLIRAHWKLLEKLIEKGRAKDIWLDYNTNVTGITDEWLSLSSNFREVYLACSIDGIGDKAAYLRPPVEWQVIEKNLARIGHDKGNIRADFCITVSAYNIFYYPEILEYLWAQDWKNFSPIPAGQVLEGPGWMSAQILPPKAKMAVREKFQQFFREKSSVLSPVKRDELRMKFDYILGFMEQKDRSSELKNFFRRTDQLDRLRNQDFKKTFPELFSLLT